MSEERDRFIARYDVSRETLDRLDRFHLLIQQWSKNINLVSRSSLPHLWDRHFADSAQLHALAPEHVGHWADLGSGAGFPAIVISILGAQRGRIERMTLVESDLRKATFLRTAIRDLGLEALVVTSRIEATEPLRANVLSARALAPLTDLLEHAVRHLAPGGHALFPKGASHGTEYTEALERFRFRCETHPSLTEPQAMIYSVSEIESV